MPPRYEYVCTLGHEFEVEQGIKDPPVQACTQTVPVQPDLPAHQEQAYQLCWAPCRRLISKTSFRLKGSGWSATGYS